jgi:serine/threonine protein kinase
MAPVALPTLAPGDTFARAFRVVRELARGAASVLLSVEPIEGAERRALKIFDPDLFQSGVDLERFTREARVAAKLEGEHLAGILEVGAEDGTPWLLLPLLEGEDLARRLQRDGPLDAADAIRVLREVAEGLQSAHDAGVVHRELCPAEVFLATSARPDAPFTVKLLGVGLAGLLERTDPSDSRADAGPDIARLAWMAPEQIQGPFPVDPRVDVWALGLLAFTTYTGSFYWKSTTAVPLAIEILGDPLPAASARAAELGPGLQNRLPVDFDRWFSRAVARDPKERFGSPREALASLLIMFEPWPILANPKGSHYDDGLRDLGIVLPEGAGPGGPYRENRRGPPEDVVIVANPKGSHYDDGLWGRIPYGGRVALVVVPLSMAMAIVWWILHR